VNETTGAGDAFMGALLARLADSEFNPAMRAPIDVAAVEASIRFACAAGAAACTQAGAMSGLPSREEVEELLART
jgi:sugar/nucleoside kinase (ribokinase family)